MRLKLFVPRPLSRFGSQIRQGRRDEKNAGKLLQDFMREVNELVDEVLNSNSKLMPERPYPPVFMHVSDEPSETTLACIRIDVCN